MKLISVCSAAVLALCSSALADSITSTTGVFSAFPAGFGAVTPDWVNAQTQPATTGSPFWNDPSDDVGTGGSHMMNIGYVLTDTGGLAGTTSVLGTDSVTETFTNADGTDPTAFSFLSSSVADNISLLFAQSSLDTGNAAQGTIFGYYIDTTFTPLYNVTDTSSPQNVSTIDLGAAGTTYGFYATVCYGGGLCETYTTGEGNFGNVSGAAAWNHFALFELASGKYALGFTAASADVGEGLGDFNDVVIEIQSTPEPASMGIMALGLAVFCAYKTLKTFHK